jgi:hypothetical protein
LHCEVCKQNKLCEKCKKKQTYLAQQKQKTLKKSASQTLQTFLAFLANFEKCLRRASGV